MSFMLQFPPSASPLPANIDKRAYVDIFVGHVNISQKVPKIPLTLLLHFAPNVEQYLEPVAMRNGILDNCRNLSFPDGSAEAYGIGVIISRMLQLSGMAAPSIMAKQPNIIGAVKILRAWRLFGINMEGISALYTHILATLWFDTVRVEEIIPIWENFEEDDLVINAMVYNMVNHHARGEISGAEFAEMREYAEGYPSFIKRIHEADKVLNREVAKEEEKLSQSEQRQRDSTELFAKLESTTEQPDPDNTAKSRYAECVENFGKARALRRQRQERASKESREGLARQAGVTNRADSTPGKSPSSSRILSNETVRAKFFHGL